MMQSVKGIFICQHRKLVYPPAAEYNVCYTCGKKQLRHPETGDGIGKFGHDLDELIHRARGLGLHTVAGSEDPLLGIRGHHRYAREGACTVLIFRNGQHREIQNYAIKDNAILVFTKRQIVRVPITELDVPSTQAANAQRGIQFRLCA
jgi:hypothetical protein